MKLEERAQGQRLSSYEGLEVGLRLTGPCGMRRKTEGPRVRAEGQEMLGPDHAKLPGRPDSQVQQFDPEWGLLWEEWGHEEARVFRIREFIQAGSRTSLGGEGQTPGR